MDTLAEAFAALLHDAPAAPVCVSPSRCVSRAAIDALAKGLCPRIQAVAPAGSVVALAAANGPGFLGALLAIRRSRCIALLLDASTPGATQQAIARSFAARLWLRAESGWGVHFLAEAIAGAAPAPLPWPECGVIKLTSGSTGRARGVAVSDRALLADVAALHAAMGLAPQDRALALVPMSFSYGLSSLAAAALAEGLVLVLPDDSSPKAPLLAARACGATFLPTVPVYLQALLKLGPQELPPSLRRIVSAGAPLAAATAQEFERHFGRRVHAFYGASEAGGICYDGDGEATLRGAVGRPLPGVEVSLLGDDGVVAVRSPAVGLGYVPEPDDALCGGRFVTSDCARFTHGELTLLGRKSECLNIDGKKVHPREIENVVRQLTGVEDVFVSRAPGREREAVAVTVACREGALAKEQILGWCRQHLPPYQVPRSVRLVAEIPRNDRGKVEM